MSTYLAAEAALLTLIRAYSGGAVFDEVNSAAEDWDVLDAPDTEVSAIVEMEGSSEEADELDDYGGHGEYVERHRIAVWVCVKRGTGEGGDGLVRAECKTLTEALKDHLRPYERLNNASGVLRAQMTRTSEIRMISTTEDPRDATHVAQQISIQVLCRAALNPVEVAAA